MEKADFLEDALKVSQNLVIAIKGVVLKQKAQVDAAGAKMARLKNLRDDAGASIALCCKKTLQVQCRKILKRSSRRETLDRRRM